jgi:glucokinase
VVYAYDPEAIILGGSISKALKYFQESMHASMSETYFPNSIEKLKIYVSSVKHISMLGAAAHVDHHEEITIH